MAEEKGAIQRLGEKSMPRNPLGVIALFVFLIEAIATISLKTVADKPFAIILVWFIIVYPSVIAVCFFVLLWFKREALFGPMDYKDDTTFRDLLLKKVEQIEAKQEIGRIDSSTALDEIFLTVDKLLELDDVWSATSVARAFLKKKEYDKSLKVLERIKATLSRGDEAYYKVLANMAYSLIGLGRYDEAVALLLEVKKLQRGRFFGPWHSLALAYAYFKSGRKDEADRWVDYTRQHGAAEIELEFFASLYPELAEQIMALAVD